MRGACGIGTSYLTLIWTDSLMIDLALKPQPSIASSSPVFLLLKNPILLLFAFVLRPILISVLVTKFDVDAYRATL